MFGFGKVHRQDSETESDNFKFGKDGFSAEPANLMVGSNLKAAKPALFGKHMNVYFNLTTGKVNIKTLPYSSSRILPVCISLIRPTARLSIVQNGILIRKILR
jgi:hypothetical protein